jgi:GLPGLI family protein
MYALIKKAMTKDNEAYLQAMFEQYKKTQPQFKKLTSTLAFSGNKTLFKPGAETMQSGMFSGDPSTTQPNIILTDLATSSSICQKKVYEETFLVRDSLRNITWKITDETRDIAGYSCRRANALIMDSIYVVAFYTDEIPVSGGPESFTGLPGMILGVALPHENVTWFATKVSERPVTGPELAAPTKGKQTNIKALKATMQAALKDWGNYAQTAYKALLL